jgi:hypothetical protein
LKGGVVWVEDELFRRFMATGPLGATRCDLFTWYGKCACLSVPPSPESSQGCAANSKVVEMVLSGAKIAPEQQISANGSRTGADYSFSRCGKQLQMIEKKVLEVGCGGWI